jgi:hypothetical protein
MSDPLSVDDIDQIVEGIEYFIIEGDEDVREIWLPYINKLTDLRADLLVGAPRGETTHPDKFTDWARRLSLALDPGKGVDIDAIDSVMWELRDASGTVQPRGETTRRELVDYPEHTADGSLPPFPPRGETTPAPLCPLCRSTLEHTGWITHEDNSTWACVNCGRRIQISPYPYPPPSAETTAPRPPDSGVVALLTEVRTLIERYREKEPRIAHDGPIGYLPISQLDPLLKKYEAAPVVAQERDPQ